MNFAPAATARRQRALDDRQYAADQQAKRAQRAREAYASWTSVTTKAQALDYVDNMARDLGPTLAEYLGAKFSAGSLYRHIADSLVRSQERLSGQASWWDADCRRMAGLSWQAANGRAKDFGA